MANIREVAQRAGVSLGTVSKVLNRPDTVPNKTRERVLIAINELNFVRNGNAHQLRAKHSQSIGFIGLDISNPFFTEQARGAEEVARASGSVVILGNSDYSLEQQEHYLRVLEEQRVQGVIVNIVENTDISRVLRLRERDMAVVILSPEAPAGVCGVEVDNVHGGELAAEHLFSLGHRRIAFIHGSLNIKVIADRYKGVQRAAQTRGLDFSTVVEDVLVENQSAGDGEKCVEKILALPNRPTAIFCANDLLALGIMRGLGKHKLTVPDAVALVGYDDIALAELLRPSLTTVRQPALEIGRTAAELLFEEVRNPTNHKHRRILYQPELIVRTSTVGGNDQ